MAGAAAAYLRLLFFPWPLAVSYGLPGVAWRWMVLGIVAAALAAAWRAARLRKQLFLAAAWIIFPLLLPILASPFMNDWTQVQDRYAYWATGGACLLVVLALKSICERVLSARRERQGLAVASLLLICLCTLGTWRQTTVWSSTEALWRHALQVTPASHWASNVLAKDLMRSKQYDAAVQVLDRALRYHPRNSDSELLMKMAQHQGR
jgi:transposase InsO family protein